MRDTQFKTSNKAVNLLALPHLFAAVVGRRARSPAIRQIENLRYKLGRASLAAGWAGVLFLLLCGSVTGARAQGLSNPNQIYGTIKFNNPAGPVLNYLNSGHGLGGGIISAAQVGGGFSSSTSVADDPSQLSAPYVITVQAGDPSGNPPVPAIPYNVTPVMNVDGSSYYFAPATSGGVIFPPALPDVLLDFCECVGLVEIQFCDVNNHPVPVPQFSMAAYLPSGAVQAGSSSGGATSTRLAVRGGNTFNVIVSINVTSGTDAFSDYFLITYSTNYTVTVGCDQIVTNKFIVPPSPIGPGGGGALGKIIGIADVLGKAEHFNYHGRTILNAFDGPLGNYRYYNIPPLSQPGYLPCAGSSPPPFVVGTPSCNSSGPFCLTNLLPSNFSTPPRDYIVAAGFYFDLHRRFEFFVSPYLYGVTVPSAGTVNLGNTFVIQPGYMVGDVFLCGPDEGTNANSCLRHIYRVSDDAHDSDGDGIPEYDADLNLGSQLRAYGLGLLGAGATHTAAGGFARLLFEGDFVATGPNKNHFVGDYNMTLGGLDSGATHWNVQELDLTIGHVDTPADRDSYINSSVGIYNPHFADVEIVPTQTVIKNHRYGFSQVIINFHTTGGTLFYPVVGAGMSFNGINFEGQPAQYTAGIQAYGTPTGITTATSDGQVVMCIPEGTYTVNPTIESVNPDGITSSHNTLLPFTLVVPPCAKITACPGLQMTLTNLPMCATNRLLHITGSTTSHTNVTSISYVLNGGAPVTVCNNCGISPSFSFNVTLADCVNILKVTVTDADGCVASVESTIHYDLTPPVFGCASPQPNLVSNGSFELGSPAFNLANDRQPLLVNSTVLTGWAVVETGNQFLWWNGSYLPLAPTFTKPASDGDLFLYFNGSQNNTSARGKITQNVTLPAGTYRLEFDMWSEPSLSGSRQAGFTADLNLVPPVSYTDLFTPPFSSDGNNPANPAVTAAIWHHVTHDFTVPPGQGGPTHCLLRTRPLMASPPFPTLAIHLHRCWTMSGSPQFVVRPTRPWSAARPGPSMSQSPPTTALAPT